MDRPALEELSAYVDWTWRQFETTIRLLGADGLIKPVPGSGWPALREALAHINLSYDGWLAELTSVPMIGLDVESVCSWDDLTAHRRQVRARFREYVESLSETEYLTPRNIKVGNYTRVCSPADILTHVLLHERGHHGDINTLLYQIGVERPLVEHISYLLR